MNPAAGIQFDFRLPFVYGCVLAGRYCSAIALAASKLK
jgi:hypothetical protein